MPKGGIDLVRPAKFLHINKFPARDWATATCESSRLCSEFSLVSLVLSNNRHQTDTTARQSLIKSLRLACSLRSLSANQRPRLGKLGAGPRQPECASLVAGQSGSGVIRIKAEGLSKIQAPIFRGQSLVVTNRHNDLE